MPAATTATLPLFYAAAHVSTDQLASGGVFYFVHKSCICDVMVVIVIPMVIV